MKTFKSNLLFVFLVFKILFAAPCAAQNKTLSISIAANDIVYDSSRQVIYATIRSEDSYNFGNKVVAIDRYTELTQI